MPVVIPSAISPDETARLVQVATGQCVLEMGAQYGYSTLVMAEVAKVVHSVDWHRGDKQAGYSRTLEAFLTNIEDHPHRDRIVVHVGRFEDVLPVLRFDAFDVVFLDGHHDADPVAHDVKALWPLLKWDGILAMHDWGLFGVEEGYRRGLFNAPDPFAVVGTLALVRKSV